MRTKKHYLMPVAAGFMVLYLVIMAVATGFVYQKYMRTFEVQYNYKRDMLEYSFLQVNKYRDNMSSQADDQEIRNEYIVAFLNSLYSDPYQKFSAVYYNDATKLIYTSEETFSMYEQGEEAFDEDVHTLVAEPLGNYLSDEEILELAQLVERSLSFAGQEPYDGCEDYEFYSAVNTDAKVGLYAFFGVKTVWKEGTDSKIIHPFTGGIPQKTRTDANGKWVPYRPKELGITWQWVHPAYQSSNPPTEYLWTTFDFPYLRLSYEDWLEWHNSTYLQEAVKDMDVDTLMALYESDDIIEGQKKFTRQYTDIKKILSSDDFLLLASECYPWRATFDYLKDVYLIGLVLMVACMAVVVYILDRTDKKRAAMEENRRNFANALAHEMKTPLGIIRGFSENMLENIKSEKRDYYLEQVGKQTDELHHLVAEMMDMSTLDADFLELQQDDLLIGDMIREQLVKLEPLIEERHLTIELEETAEFHVTADEKYLSKAIYNLLDNAVSYSDAGGTIQIVIDSKHCSIENPCSPIEPEKLEHLFDAFYQGNTNRGTQGSHRGLGLYLTRKIFALSNLTVEIKNTEHGVKVSFY